MSALFLRSRGSKLIAGLGNPGQKYRFTRHNLGARAVEGFAGSNGLKLKKNIFLKSLVSRAKICGQETYLAFPQTYMNLSGQALSLILRKKKISPKDLLVVCDDISLPLDSMRIRPEGSSGGHKGLDSIIECLGTTKFARLRLGIGPLPKGQDLSEYVLEDFRDNEQKAVKDLIFRSYAAMENWLAEGIDKCMSAFNKKAEE